jgi:hypothetical protein
MPKIGDIVLAKLGGSVVELELVGRAYVEDVYGYTGRYTDQTKAGATVDFPGEFILKVIPCLPVS